LWEDNKGIFGFFSAEGYGVYRHNGNNFNSHLKTVDYECSSKYFEDNKELTGLELGKNWSIAADKNYR
jgi:hypothetical protein